MDQAGATTRSRSLDYDRTIGLATMEGRGFFFPSGTDLGKDGRIFTVSRGIDIDGRTVRITVYDLESEFFGTFGGIGDGEGQFTSPTSLAIDSTGRVYVADEYTHRIVVFEPDGDFVADWGVQGTGPGQLDSPSGLAFDKDDNLYVSDHRNQRIQKFTRDGQYLSGFGSAGSGEGELNLPWGLTVDAGGEVYVADWGNDRVQRFTADGVHVATYGRPGSGDGELRRPADVAVDGEGYVHVADWGNERVQVFDPEGGFVAKLRGSATLSPWAQEFLSANVEEAQARATANLEPDTAQFGGDPHEESAHIEKLFWAPVSVKVDRDGRLYVTESNRHRVQVYRWS